MEPTEVLPRPTCRAANAMKHGFCAVKYVSSMISSLAERIRLELMRIHEPCTDEEIDTIEDLALAKAHLQHVESGWDKTCAEDASKAREHFQRQGQAQFWVDINAWVKAPAMQLDTFGGTFQGAACLVRLWSGIVERLAPGGPGLTFDQASKAALAKGSLWEISLMNNEGAWIMTRFVRTAIDPAGELRNWIDRSGGATDRSRADWYLERTPDRAVCRAELAAEAARQLEHWTIRLNELRLEYETRSEAAAESFMGVLPGDRTQTEKFRLHLRYLTAARNQVERVHKRLDALKKGRNLATHRAARKSGRIDSEPPPEAPPTEHEPAAPTESPVTPGPIPVPAPATAIAQSTLESESNQATEATQDANADSDSGQTETGIETCARDSGAIEIPAIQPSLAKRQVISDPDLLNPGVPLAVRIDKLANILGVTFEEAFEIGDEDHFSMDFESFATPAERQEFEAWRRRMERTIAEDHDEDYG